MVEGAKQGNMGCDQRCFEVAPPVKIPDQNVKGQQTSRLVRIISCNGPKLARQGIRQAYTRQGNLKACVSQAVTRNCQYSISNRNLEGLGKFQRYQFVVYEVWGFGRVKLEYAVNRAGNRSRDAGRAPLQATGGMDAVGGGHRGIFWIWILESVRVFVNFVTKNLLWLSIGATIVDEFSR